MLKLDRSTCAGALEHSILSWCSPTLAGVKPASAFSLLRYHCVGHRVDGRQVMAELRDGLLDAVLRDINAATEPKGVRVEAFARRRGSTMIYVHRPELFDEFVGAEPVATMLEIEGYDVRDPRACLLRLRERIASFDRCPRDRYGRDRYPHEIGFFLGYPLHDVLAFVRQRQRGVLLRGCWNVYDDVAHAQSTFNMYDVLTGMRMDRYQEGAAFAELVG